MRKFLLSTFLLFLFGITSSFAVTRTAVSNGNWTTNSVWDCNCAPSVSDNIVIPPGITITISFPGITFTNMANIIVTVNGTLNLSTAALTLDAGDKLIIGAGGQVRSSGIGGTVLSGGTPIIITTGSPINGPATITGGSLPVTVLYFKGHQQGDQVMLEWASATEKNFDYYQVERSFDGGKFEELAKVSGSGFSTEKKEYSAIDSRPGSDKIYYRLVAFDLDGSSEQFETISIEFNAMEKKIYAFPNPAKAGNDLTIEANFRLSQNDYLTIHNSLGEVVFRSALKDGNPIVVNSQTMGTGVHIISLQSAKHGRINERIILE